MMDHAASATTGRLLPLRLLLRTRTLLPLMWAGLLLLPTVRAVLAVILSAWLPPPVRVG